MAKRKDGRYKVSTTINGKRYYFYGSTKKAATKAMEEHINKLTCAINYTAGLTLYQWSEEWLRIKESTVAASTLASYKYVLTTYIRPYLGNLQLDAITTLNVRALLRTLCDKSARTQSYVITVLRMMLKLAVEEELIPKNVADFVKKPKAQKVREMVTLSKAQVDQFLDVISDAELHTIFRLAFTSGLRRSELLGLRWSDVDFKAGTISVNQTVLNIEDKTTVVASTKNKSSKRTISMDPATMAELKQHKVNVSKRRLQTLHWEDHNLVFPGKRGGARNPQKVSKHCRRFAKAIGVEGFSMHGTRHTHATLLIEAGVNFKVIQMRLGHSSYQMTMDIYSHLTPVMEADIKEKLVAIF